MRVPHDGETRHRAPSEEPLPMGIVGAPWTKRVSRAWPFV